MKPGSKLLHLICLPGGQHKVKSFRCENAGKLRSQASGSAGDQNSLAHIYPLRYD